MHGVPGSQGYIEGFLMMLRMFYSERCLRCSLSKAAMSLPG